jgi:hypothetical protein
MVVSNNPEDVSAALSFAVNGLQQWNGTVEWNNGTVQQ